VMVHFSCGTPAFCARAESAKNRESTIGMAVRKARFMGNYGEFN
jgi:hypothetical protein